MSEQIVVEKDITPTFKKWLIKAFGENIDKVDFESEYDKTLNFDENKNHFTEKFSREFCDEYKEYILLKDEKAKEQAQKEIMQNQVKKQEKELINEWRKSDYQDIDIKSFDIPKHYIQMVCRGICNSCILIGSGGTGKTFMTINILKKEKCNFVYQNTYTTSLELYKYLYDNKDKVIILDDVEGLDNPKSLAILKSALWETDGKRIITMNTADRVLQEIPKIFEFKGKIIMLSNRLNEKDEHTQALITRSNYYELNFSYKEKLRIMKEITKKEYKNTNLELREKALNLVVKNTDIYTNELNFRTLIKTYDLLLYDKNRAEKLLKATLKINTDIKLITELMKNDKSINEQIEEFRLKTGKSRATYFRLKERVKELLI